MDRPTIRMLATEAGVSVSTVNRILSGADPVKAGTIQRVQAAAERIGFYGIGAIDDRMRKAMPSYRFGFLLQQSTRQLYQHFGKRFTAACRERRDEVIDPRVEFVDLLTPENVAMKLRALAARCDVSAVIAADHPLISQTIRELREAGKPVIAFMTDQSAPERAAFVGADNWKVGRTAAWLMMQMTRGAGRIAVFIGHHRYQCQDVADVSFRSYLREHAPFLTTDDSRPTHENADEAHEMVKELLASTDDLTGIFIVGGGISGVLRALREAPEARRRGIRLICRDIGPETRRGLSEGLITAALCHPVEATSALLVQTMVDVLAQAEPIATLHRTLPFEIVTPENV